ncbi:MAG: prolipoprotein diacylglyceryl transferase [Planctomycetota bacterium]
MIAALAPAVAPIAPDRSWLHDLSPFLWRISGDFGIRWYGLSYILGAVIAFLMLRWLAKRGFTPIPVDRALDAIVSIMLGAVIGGRLGYIILYQPSLLGLVDGFPWWGVLAIDRGGMASHGGIVGAGVACWWVSRGFLTQGGERIGAAPTLHVLDLLAMLGPAGLMLGRLANFINGELVGLVVARPGEPGPWWAVRYPNEILERKAAELPQTITQRAQIDAIVARFTLPGETFDDGFARMLSALQGGNADLARELGPLLSARAPSQLLQALAEGVIVGLVVWVVARAPRRPGIIGAWFLITYGAGRIATEFVRLPDAHLAAQRLLGLSRGQWLSALMVVGGIALLLILRSRPATKMGGWARRAPQSP